MSTVLEFVDGAGWFLPRTSTTHDVSRDASETDSVTAISDCREAEASSPPHQPSADPPSTGPPLKAGIVLSLVFNASIDSALAAAGDAISATIREAHVQATKEKLDWLLGMTVGGRVTRVEHRMAGPGEPAFFVVSVAFETLDVKGVVSPFYAKLILPPSAITSVSERSTYPPPSGHGRSDWSGTFMFASRASHYVFPAPFESTWLTAEP
jgi:hypothetical protein